MTLEIKTKGVSHENMWRKILELERPASATDVWLKNVLMFKESNGSVWLESGLEGDRVPETQRLEQDLCRAF